MKRCGLLGAKLGHSYSPAIHAELGDYEYKLYEKTPEELGDFLLHGEWDGLNVTIPYKKDVVPYCDELSPLAKSIGSVNTLVRRADGTLYGDNTDAYGFALLFPLAGIDPKGKKCLVFGSGGASVMACAVLRNLGAREVLTISRHGKHNYENLSRNTDAEVLVNATPVGMYPNNGAAVVDLAPFTRCEGVVDVVYNPARTALLLQAEALGIPCINGLPMLVAQAKRSSEQFQGRDIPESEIARITAALEREMHNIVLLGMPGSGKSTVARLLGEALSRPVLEADAVLAEESGMTIPEIFAKEGEEGFRRRETAVLAALGKRSGIILSTGGGCITREENYPLLHQNGRLFCLTRSLDKLPTDGRPLSQSQKLQDMYAVRKPLYERFADVMIDNDGELGATVEAILKKL